MAEIRLAKVKGNERRRLATRHYGAKWYKVTTRGGLPLYGVGGYSLPKGGKPGSWHVWRWSLIMCQSGYHVTQKPHNWVQFHRGTRLFLVDATGFKRSEKDPRKTVCRAIRFRRGIKRNSKEWHQLMRR